MPKEKLICAIGNYGYDWTLSIPRHPKGSQQASRSRKVLDTEDLPVSEAWQRASDADADLDLDYDTLNPHFEYIDEDTNQRHVVWFLDGVTVLNEMRAARELGLQTFALWRLGEEDSSLWNIWDKPSSPDVAAGARHRAARPRRRHRRRRRHPPRHRPAPARQAHRQVDTDEPDPRKKLIIDEHMDVYPRHLHHPAVRLPSQRGRALLRRRSRSQVDAEDPRHSQATKTPRPPSC